MRQSPRRGWPKTRIPGDDPCRQAGHASEEFAAAHRGRWFRPVAGLVGFLEASPHARLHLL